MKKHHLDKNGFTLVEMAIVLVIVGLLIGMGVGMIGPLTNRAKMNETRESLSANVEAINSWAAGNNKLPDSTTAATSTSNYINVIKQGKDAWSRDIIYLYDTSLSPAISTKDTICGRKSTNITINNTSTGITVQNVAFLMLSGGENASIDSNIGGVPLTSATGPRSAATTVTVNSIDDIVRWVTLDELRSKVGCHGAQLKILNNELPPATVSAQYPNATASSSLKISVDGGATPGTFRWCVEAPTTTPLPTGLNFTPALNGAIRVTPNSCNATNPLAENGWISSSTLTISGTPASGMAGSYNFTIYVRDNNDTTSPNDNIASKAFVLTVNP